MTDDTPIADGLCYAAPATPTPPPQQDAVVACRQLGLGAPPTSGYKYDATGGSGSIHMDDLRCTGAETMLTSCSQATYHNCGHSEDVGLVCGPGPPSLPPPLPPPQGTAPTEDVAAESCTDNGCQWICYPDPPAPAPPPTPPTPPSPQTPPPQPSSPPGPPMPPAGPSLGSNSEDMSAAIAGAIGGVVALLLACCVCVYCARTNDVCAQQFAQCCASGGSETEDKKLPPKTAPKAELSKVSHSTVFDKPTEPMSYNNSVVASQVNVQMTTVTTVVQQPARPMAVAIDYDNDGIVDAIGVDTTGDGMANMVIPAGGAQAPAMVEVTVPEDVFAGMMFTARMPNGQLAQVEVPPGGGPGAVIKVQASA